MLKHADIWAAIDRLAATANLSPSGLAKRAGLDATAFNKSKRVAADGRPRWPSTESIAKILAATGTDFNGLTDLIGDGAGHGRRGIPVIGYARAGDAGYFDDAGYPAGSGWDEIAVPDIGDPNAYALAIQGDSMIPVFRDGATVIVSPAASIRRGDRVVARTREGEVMAKELTRRGALETRLKSLNPAHPDRCIAAADLAWIARIVWASQ